MKQTTRLRLRVALIFDEELVDEHLLELDTYVTMGSERRGNLVTWARLPRQLPLVEPRRGRPHVILPEELEFELVGAPGARPGLAPGGAVPLEPGLALEIDLRGARVRVDLFDPGVLGEVCVPRAHHRSGRPALGAAIGASCAAVTLGALGLGALLAPAPRAPSPAPFEQQASNTEQAPSRQLPAPTKAPARTPSPADPAPTLEESDLVPAPAPAPAATLPAPLEREAPELGGEIDDLLAQPADMDLDEALARARPHERSVSGMATRGKDGPQVVAGEVVAIEAGPIGRHASRGFDTGREVKKPRIVDEVPRLDQTVEVSVQATIKDNVRRFQYCYETSLKRKSALEGAIDFRFTVNPSGRAVGIRAVEDTLEDAALSSCLTLQMSRLRFPAPEEATPSRARFYFAPGD